MSHLNTNKKNFYDETLELDAYIYWDIDSRELFSDEELYDELYGDDE